MSDKPRGLAALDPERRREIASLGGKAAHRQGVAHQFTPEEAAEAGGKGGRVSQATGRGHRFTAETAREAGRKGGQRRGKGS